jgi:SAM-dependent methyltransferase
MGHSSFLIRSMVPGLSVVMADHDFTNLYLARRFFAPNSPALCLDADARLPFADDGFDAAFCMDAFHYISGKEALAREIDRVVNAEGVLLLPHLHNTLAQNPVPGSPLSPEQYLQLWQTRHLRGVSEPRVLADFVRDGVIDLADDSDFAALNRANAMAIVSGPPERMWRRHDVRDVYFAARPIGLNPLYRPALGESVDLRMTWENLQLREECSATAEYMPSSRQVDASLLQRIARHDFGPEDDNKVQELQREFVLVPLPENYG